MEKQEMRNGRINVKIFNIITALFLAFSLTLPVHAMTEIESAGIKKDAAGSIQIINWEYDGTNFNLYKIADLNDDMQFEYTDTYKDVAKDIDISLENETELTADKWMKDANKLLDVIEKNDIKPDYSGKTYQNTYKFSSLSIGLYLLKGDKVKIGNKTVTSQPCLISVPNRVVVTDPWNYDIKTEVKQADPTYEYTPTPAPSATPGPTETPKSSTSTDTSDPYNLKFYASVIAADVLVIALILFVRSKKTSKES